MVQGLYIGIKFVIFGHVNKKLRYLEFAVNSL